MTSSSSSLIKREANQVDFFEALEVSLDKGIRVTGPKIKSYTAARFQKKHPQLYKLCVYLLSRGAGRLLIADLLNVSHHTIHQVLENEGELIDKERARLSSLARYGQGLCIENIISRLDNPEELTGISTKDLAFILRYLAVAEESFTPAKSSHNEKAIDVESHDIWNSKLKDFKESFEVKMHSDGGKNSAESSPGYSSD